MPIALDRAAYFGVSLSANITETPEGYLVCKNAVIGRSGFQTYKVSEIKDPQGLLAGMPPDTEIELWRDPAEVFSADTLDSFEGKSITIVHPPTFLHPDSDKLEVGHAQNIRRGTEPLESGDIPMLADLVIKRREGIDAVCEGMRELSCGYAYRLRRTGNRYEQHGIRGNHIAIVDRARAGDEARIYDAAPAQERKPMKITLRSLFGRGLKDLAKDATPEQMEEALEIVGHDGLALHAEPLKPVVIPAPTTKLVSVGKTPAGVELFMSVAVDTAGVIQGPVDDLNDTKAMVEGMADADTEELQAQLNRSLSEGGKEATDAEPESEDKGEDAEHPEGCMCGDCKTTRDAAPPMDPKKEEGKDVNKEVPPEPVLAENQRPQSQLDTAMDVLNILKPVVARSKDLKVQRAFDTALKSVTRARGKARAAGAPAGGGYGGFRQAASRLHDSAGTEPKESAAQKQAREFDEQMVKIRTESRAKNIAARRR